MHSFESEFLEKQSIPHLLLRTVRIIGEYRGKEALFMRQTPQASHGRMSAPQQGGCYMGEKGIMNPLMGSETAIASNSESERDHDAVNDIKAWQEKPTEGCRTIILVAGKIPENILQEDPKLLMWYDQAITHTGGES